MHDGRTWITGIQNTNGAAHGHNPHNTKNTAHIVSCVKPLQLAQQALRSHAVMGAFCKELSELRMGVAAQL